MVILIVFAAAGVTLSAARVLMALVAAALPAVLATVLTPHHEENDLLGSASFPAIPIPHINGGIGTGNGS
jgi:hypothetical protein